MSSPGSVLIVVHPGSCCGSANLTIGRSDARASREGLISELRKWSGDIAVIDGEFSDELPLYPVLNEALVGAISRNTNAGYKAARVEGDAADEFDQAAAATALIQKFGLSPHSHSIKLTGAWLEQVHEDGCIDDVFDVMTAAGFSVDVLDSAFTIHE
ncbi:MAG: hypothetical protein DI537_10105 [Stutzerimonas stutzeri]|nr:MAG: hypothetical protein DI537_10105 [Stutzerimonas stutzeri]